MPYTINLHLLDNKQIIGYKDGIPLGNENSYRLTEYEENVSEFHIVSKPTEYQNADYYVIFINSQGKRAFLDDVIPNTVTEDGQLIVNDTFTLPIGMSVAGYGYIRIYAIQNDQRTEFLPIKVKIWKTIDTWHNYATDLDTLATQRWVMEYVATHGGGGGGGGAVASVNGKTGVVVLNTGDISATTNKRYVTDEQLAYLEEQTYAKPDIETFTLTPSETAYEIGSTVNITGFIHKETNTNNIVGDLTLRKNGAIVKSDIIKSSIDTGVAYSDTFNINGIITYALQLTDTRGGTASKAVTLSSYTPSYVGALTIGDITASDLGYLTKINKTSLVGNCSATISTSTGYVYFVSSQAITDIKDRDTGFSVSYTQRDNISTTINGVSVTYYVYRTDELIQGTYNYVVS